MKKLCFSIFALVISLSTFAQRTADAQQITDELIKVYDLTQKQSAEMLVIQQRKVRNLNQITDLKESDVKKYRNKHRAIQHGTDASIKRMLTKSQREIFDKLRMERRIERAEKFAQLKESGKSLEEIENELIEEGF